MMDKRILLVRGLVLFDGARLGLFMMRGFGARDLQRCVAWCSRLMMVAGGLV